MPAMLPATGLGVSAECDGNPGRHAPPPRNDPPVPDTAPVGIAVHQAGIMSQVHALTIGLPHGGSTVGVTPPSMARPLLSQVLECARESSDEPRGMEPATTPHHGSGGRTGHAGPVGANGAGTIKRVVLSSCHDVTIMALLYALDSKLLVRMMAGVASDDEWNR